MAARCKNRAAISFVGHFWSEHYFRRRVLLLGPQLLNAPQARTERTQGRPAYHGAALFLARFKPDGTTIRAPNQETKLGSARFDLGS